MGVTILIFLWNKMDKQFEDQNKRIDALHDEVKGLPLKIMEMLNKAPL
ncbi:MAG: hypothetical protein OXF25_02625 [Cyanobacteria bacterium MAG CAR3_bin_5]|nr:hypothetical protein [Cyanobacteria bacterium MAG CAR3_bin_5]